MINNKKILEYVPYLIVSITIFIFDFITKQWAVNNLNYATPIAVFNNLNWTLLFNEGVAFSFMSNLGGWKRWPLTILTSIIAIAIIIYLFKLDLKKEKLTAIALSFILGGAFGNIYDRAMYGYVIDFIDCYINDLHWPAFNIADSFICLGVTLLTIQTFIEWKSSSKS